MEREEGGSGSDSVMAGEDTHEKSGAAGSQSCVQLLHNSHLPFHRGILNLERDTKKSLTVEPFYCGHLGDW